MKNIFKSKSFIILIICILISTAGLMVGSLYLTREIGGSKDLAAIAGPNVREVVPAGIYKNLYILDGEKGLFLGEKISRDRVWVLLTEDGPIKELKFDGYFKKSNKNHVVLQGEGQCALIDLRRDLKGDNTIITSHADIDEEGNYYLYLNPDTLKYQVFDQNDKELFSIDEIDTDSADSVRLIGKDGYIVKVKNQEDILLNMETGEEVYKTNDLDQIVKYTAGHYIISKNEKKGSHTVEYQVLNDDFEAFDPVHSMNSLYANEEMIIYQTNRDTFFLTKDGCMEYDGEWILPVAACSDSIADGNEFPYKYFTVNEENKIELIAESKYLSFRDFEDGFAPAYDGKDTSFEEDQSTYMGKAKWGFVDKDMNPVTEFKFNDISKTENGYAVVYLGRNVGIIDLKGVQ